jgi:hypothetical protein
MDDDDDNGRHREGKLTRPAGMDRPEAVRAS